MPKARTLRPKKSASRRAPAKPKTASKKVAKKPKSAYDAVASQMGTLTPYLAVHDAKAAIGWYRTVFAAKPLGETMATPDGKVMHATLKIGDSLLFLSDILPQSDLTDATRSGTPVNVNLFHKDCDKIWDRAVANGAKVTMPLDDMFWGDRYGRIIDPFGHSWAISRKSKLSAKELEAKRLAMMAQMGQPPQ